MRHHHEESRVSRYHATDETDDPRSSSFRDLPEAGSNNEVPSTGPIDIVTEVLGSPLWLELGGANPRTDSQATVRAHCASSWRTGVTDVHDEGR